MDQILASKVAQASVAADQIGRVSTLGGAAVALGDLAGWLTQNATWIGLVIAAVGMISSQLMSWWFKRRLLKIAEVHGVNVEAGDE